MLEKVKDILGMENGEVNIPGHIGISTSGIELWAKENGKGLDEANKKSFANMLMVLREQIRLKIPYVTIYLMREDMDKEGSHFKVLVDSIVEFFPMLKDLEEIHSNKVKVSIIGKWYNLPSRVVDPIKEVVESTRDYNQFYLNFCINYDGQEEMTDACRLIARQVAAGKLQPESISKSTIKESLYSSYFPPPDLIIKNGKKRSTRGFLLWDSAEARIHFSEKLWPDFTKSDFEKALHEQ
ncbi:di-trans,poly-cis-decaprenylcistransferase [Candidatus Woesearchaeota archaeon]|nr:di-trans,poly-cis-decaprenylcistransferase [Candidatus Woesearchaeota archaeon]